MENKYDFIVNLLEKKNLTTEQREKIILLTKDEIKKDNSIGQELADRISDLEDIIISIIDEKSSKELQVEETSAVKQKKFDKYFEPSSLYNYLFEYNQNEILSSTCHEIDSNALDKIANYCETENYDFDKHLKKIHEAFEEHDKKFAPGRVKGIIRGYLTGRNYQGKPIEKSHKFFSLNWSSIELQNWCKLNQGVPPNINEGLMNQIQKTGYEFSNPFNSKEGENILNFSDFVIYFKKLYHIRKGNTFKSIIEKENQKYSSKINFILSDHTFPTNIEFFSDIERLIQAYNIIIELILEFKINENHKEQVKLSLIEKEQTIEFSIIHLGSIYGKTLTNTIDRLGTKYFDLIKYQINGLCNFYLQADFENNETYRIGIWNKPNLWVLDKPKPQKIKNIGGVEHVFEIVKPKK